MAFEALLILLPSFKFSSSKIYFSIRITHTRTFRPLSLYIAQERLFYKDEKHDEDEFAKPSSPKGGSVLTSKRD